VFWVSDRKIRFLHAIYLLATSTCGLIFLTSSYLFAEMVVDGETLAKALDGGSVFLIVWVVVAALIIGLSVGLRKEPLFSSPKGRHRIAWGPLLANWLFFSVVTSVPNITVAKVALHSSGYILAALCFFPYVRWVRGTVATLPPGSPLMSPSSELEEERFLSAS
jgi:hypothetical protein